MKKELKLMAYTKKIMKELDESELYVTHLNIAYKIIKQFENNEELGELTENKLQDLVNLVYGNYIKSPTGDTIDQIINKIL